MDNVNDIVDNYKKLVYSVVAKFKGYYDIDDLKQVGMIGLIKAYNHFDSSYDTKFSTFAYTYILGEVLKYVREDKNIRVNKNLIRISRSIEKAREALSQKLMRRPTDNELCSFLDIDISLLQEAEASIDFVKSLDYILNESSDDKNLSLYNSLGKEDINLDPSIQDLRHELQFLPESERKLIYDRYFMDKTQTELSKEMGMSQVQVSRYESKVLTKLKNKLQ